MQARPYQIEARAKVYAALREVPRVLLVMPTGAGKTVVFTGFARDCMSKEKKVLILVDTEELMDQAAQKLRDEHNIEPAIEKATERAHHTSMVVIASAQSMNAKRLKRWRRDHFGLVIVDEAHCFTSEFRQRIIDHFCIPLPGKVAPAPKVVKDEDGEELFPEEEQDLGEPTAKLIGVTATPDTTGKKALSNIYSKTAYEISMSELISQGYLCPITVQTIPLKIQLPKVEQTGDFRNDKLVTSITPYFEEIARLMSKIDRKFLVFTPTVESAQLFCNHLRKQGMDAGFVCGDAGVLAAANEEDRGWAIEAFDIKDGKCALVNSYMLTKGFDCPSITGIVNLRATTSKILYQQIIGRGTRILPGKTDLLVLDFLWQFDMLTLGKRKGLCRPSCLAATSKQEEEEMQKILESGEEVDLLHTHRKVKADVMGSLARKLMEASNMKASKYHIMGVIADDLGSVSARQFIGHKSSANWELQEIDKHRYHTLRQFGVPDGLLSNLDNGQAHKLIAYLQERRRNGLATLRQLKALKRYGFHVDETKITFTEASAMINRRVNSHLTPLHV